jgi:hypothetical protein
MAYPFQPPTENAYQVAGKALMQGGEVLGSMRDMIEKRKMALIAQRMAEIKAQQEEEDREMRKQLQEQTIASSKAEMNNKAKEEARKALEAENQQNFRNIANIGKAVPIDYQTEVGPQLPTMEGSPINPNVKFTPLNKDQYLEEGLKTGAIDLEKYATASRESQRNPMSMVNEEGYKLFWDAEKGDWFNTGEKARQPMGALPSYQAQVIERPDGSQKVVYVNPKNPNDIIDPVLDKTPPEGSMTHIAGLKPIAGVKITPKSVDKVKTTKQTYDDLKQQLKNYKDAYGVTGTEAVGANAESLESMQTGIKLSLKELENLGVLNGPDLILMNKMVPDAGGLGAKGRSFLNPVLGDKFYRQIDVLDKRLESKLNSAIKANGFERDNGNQPNKKVTSQDIDNMTAEQLKAFLGQND